MARERIIKDPPKRGKLTKSQVKRAVEKVVLGKPSDGETMSSMQYRKTRLRLGVTGVELQDSQILQAFVEAGLLLPDVPLTNHSIELRLWVPWPVDRTDFSLYKIDPNTGQMYDDDSGFMMEVEHTKTNFCPQLPDSVWENAPRVHWETFSEHVEDSMKIIIQTQHLRRRDWSLLPEGDSHWVSRFNEFLGPQHVLLVCAGGFSSPVGMLKQCLDKNLDRNSNITDITMFIENCVDFEREELGELIGNFVVPIKFGIETVSADIITGILKSVRSPDDVLGSTQIELGNPFERSGGGVQIGFDFAFSEDDSSIFIDRELLFDTTDIGDDIHEVISNTIKAMEKRRGLDNIEDEKLDRQKELVEEL